MARKSRTADFESLILPQFKFLVALNKHNEREADPDRPPKIAAPVLQSRHYLLFQYGYDAIGKSHSTKGKGCTPLAYLDISVIVLKW